MNTKKLMSLKYDVFVSYGRVNGRPHAERIDQYLTNAGFSTWCDTRDIDIYQDFTTEIETAIKESKYLLCCITADVEHSESLVRREIDYALAMEKPIIVARFENIVPPIRVISHTRLDFYVGWDTAFAQLCDMLREITDNNLNPEQFSDTRDPFRPYLERLFVHVAGRLQRDIVRLIDLGVVATTSTSSWPQHDPGYSSIGDQLPSNEPRADQGVSNNTWFSEQPNEILSFSEAFEYYNGRVFLLGGPGTGKTITMMAFARDAIERRLADSAAPLPILGSIATWEASKRLGLPEWLAMHSSDLTADVIRREIEAGRVVLLLDGLDELNDKTEEMDTLQQYKARERFLELIPSTGKVVITCRNHEYMQVNHGSSLTTPVIMTAPDKTQLQQHLHEVQEDLRAAMEGDNELRILLQTPLALNLFTLAYRNNLENTILLRDLHSTPGALRDEVFNAYIIGRFEWEERSRGPLSFTLQEIRGVLGQVAMENAAGGDREDKTRRKENILENQDFLGALTSENFPVFIELVTRIQLLAPLEDGGFCFVHTLLLNYFAFHYALRHLDGCEESTTRCNAASALGKVGDPRAVDLLVSVLSDQDASVGWRAASALGDIGDARAVEPLISIVNHDDSSSIDAFLRRQFAAVSLGKLGDTRAVQPLIATLCDNNTLFFVRMFAAGALGDLGSPQALEPLIVAALHDKDDMVRSSAAHALGKLGSPQALEPLIAALHSENEDLRESAASALGLLGDLRAFEPLATALQSDDCMLRRESAGALGELGDSRATELLITALHDSDKFVRARAAEALGKLGDARAISALVPLLDDEYPKVLESVASALLDFGESAIQPLIEALDDDNVPVSTRAALILGQLGEPAILSLISAFTKGDLDFCNTITNILHHLVGEPAIEYLVAALQDKNRLIRACVCATLIKFGDSGVDSIIAALEVDDYAVRQTAAHALGVSGDPRVIKPLIRLLSDKSQGVRSTAVEALRNFDTIEACAAVENYEKAYSKPKRKKWWKI